MKHDQRAPNYFNPSHFDWRRHRRNIRTTRRLGSDDSKSKYFSSSPIPLPPTNFIIIIQINMFNYFTTLGLKLISLSRCTLCSSCVSEVIYIHTPATCEWEQWLWFAFHNYMRLSRPLLSWLITFGTLTLPHLSPTVVQDHQSE